MLTSLRKSSSVSSFSIACFRFTQCTEFLLFFTQMYFQWQFVLEDSLIYFADRGEGEQDWYVRGDFRFMNFTTFCYLIFNFLLYLEDFFFTHDIYPHPHPRPTTFSYTRRRTFAAHARTLFVGLKVCRFRWRALNLPTCCVLFLVLLGIFLVCTSLVIFPLCILTG